MQKPAHPILLIPPIFPLLFSLFLAAATANAAEAPSPPPAPVAAAESVQVEDAPLVVFNRTVFVFRAPFLGALPERRAARAKATLDEALRGGGSHEVSIRKNPEGRLLMIGDTLAFVIVAVTPTRCATKPSTTRPNAPLPTCARSSPKPWRRAASIPWPRLPQSRPSPRWCSSCSCSRWHGCAARSPAR